MGSVRLAFVGLLLSASGSSNLFRFCRSARATGGDGGGVGNRLMRGRCCFGGVKALTSLALLQKIGRSLMTFRLDMLMIGSCDGRGFFKQCWCILM